MIVFWAYAQVSVDRLAALSCDSGEVEASSLAIGKLLPAQPPMCPTPHLGIIICQIGVIILT